MTESDGKDSVILKTDDGMFHRESIRVAEVQCSVSVRYGMYCDVP
jgi:hypothetical protein